jgi:hypothetical protein
MANADDRIGRSKGEVSRLECKHVHLLLPDPWVSAGLDKNRSEGTQSIFHSLALMIFSAAANIATGSGFSKAVGFGCKRFCRNFGRPIRLVYVYRQRFRRRACDDRVLTFRLPTVRRSQGPIARSSSTFRARSHPFSCLRMPRFTIRTDCKSPWWHGCVHEYWPTCADEFWPTLRRVTY